MAIIQLSRQRAPHKNVECAYELESAEVLTLLVPELAAWDDVAVMAEAMKLEANDVENAEWWRDRV